MEYQTQTETRFRCPYVFKEYWSNTNGTTQTNEVYWASLDLEKFYPSIPISACVESIILCLPDTMREEAAIVLKRLAKFPLDLAGWSQEDLRHIDLDVDRKLFHRLPTGLLVSGFLANAALLRVDKEVEIVLPKGRVAHFRYVDDHIILAKSPTELVSWVTSYHQILQRLGSGAHINPSKTEPKELGSLLDKITSTGQVAELDQEQLQIVAKGCRLDPDFPSPLMTKTIALVSSIGRTDFTTLEDDELSNLTQQLEHLLLVEIPETEMPARTRLAFAATRLARIVEARLAAPETMSVGTQKGAYVAQVGNLAKPMEESTDIEKSLARISGIQLHVDQQALSRMANRAFNLIRHVLRERPDRVRLWTNALVIARRLGSSGLRELFQDIDQFGKNSINGLARYYILGNSYAVLATQAILAARILCDQETAGWRRAAALRFLRDLSSFSQQKNQQDNPWFVERSIEQFCVGLYCAHLILTTAKDSSSSWGISFSQSMLATGYSCLSSNDRSPTGRVAHAWWASRFELRTPVRQAPATTKALGELIKSLDEADDFWTFFPSDAPLEVLNRIANKSAIGSADRSLEGWWFDALTGRGKKHLQSLTDIPKPVVRVKNALAYFEKSELLPLPLWAEIIWQGQTNKNSWRIGEWTCLEIVRQAAVKLSSDAEFNKRYISNASKAKNSNTCAHPFNFLLPISLAKYEAESWHDWKDTIRSGNSGMLCLSLEKHRLRDYRYSPLVQNLLETSQNQIRGLGLILFGLLARTFMLPVQWNGLGHESLLRHLPQLLQDDVTYSSLTLGILNACLQPRANENIFAAAFSMWFVPHDDDTSSDPIRLLGPSNLAKAIEIAQNELEKNQLSTMNRRPRQLTPVNLMHLTSGDWRTYFSDVNS